MILPIEVHRCKGIGPQQRRHHLRRLLQAMTWPQLAASPLVAPGGHLVVDVSQKMRGSQVLREAVGVLYIEQRGKQTSQAAANAGQPATVGRGQVGARPHALLWQPLLRVLPSQLPGGSGH